MVQLAGVVGLVRVLAILFLIVAAVRLFTRFVLPWLLRLFARRIQRNLENQMRDQMRDFGASNTQADAGPEVKVRGRKKGKRDFNDDELGEYVDFEELD